MEMSVPDDSGDLPIHTMPLRYVILEEPISHACSHLVDHYSKYRLWLSEQYW
jgi:hypothetical protein